jgi:prepilin-type N-terminal cleavage/methylation domain-containing protein
MLVRRVPRHGSSGFTLIELMIVVVIIGLLIGVAVPSFVKYRRNAKCARTAAEMKSFAAAFVAYQAAHGELPPDSHATLPPGMDEFINPAIWADGTPLGGFYNWEGPSTYGYAAISIFNSDRPLETFQVLDSIIDDGDLATGRFTIISSRPTLMIFGNP